nr:MAG TPA: hypothetical protein [Caudoviricetes sp.]
MRNPQATLYRELNSEERWMILAPRACFLDCRDRGRQ